MLTKIGPYPVTISANELTFEYLVHEHIITKFAGPLTHITYLAELYTSRQVVEIKDIWWPIILAIKTGH